MFLPVRDCFLKLSMLVLMFKVKVPARYKGQKESLPENGFRVSAAGEAVRGGSFLELCSHMHMQLDNTHELCREF